MAAARSLTRVLSSNLCRLKFSISSGVLPVAISSAVVLPEAGAALNPQVPQPQFRMKPSSPSTLPMMGA